MTAPNQQIARELTKKCEPVAEKNQCSGYDQNYVANDEKLAEYLSPYSLLSEYTPSRFIAQVIAIVRGCIRWKCLDNSGNHKLVS